MSVSRPPFAVINPVAVVVELFVTAPEFVTVPECVTFPENVPPVAGTVLATLKTWAASIITTSPADRAARPVIELPVVAVKSVS